MKDHILIRFVDVAPGANICVNMIRKKARNKIVSTKVNHAPFCVLFMIFLLYPLAVLSQNRHRLYELNNNESRSKHQWK